MSIRFSSGHSFAVNAPGGAGGGAWGWEGVVPVAIRRGEAFTITVSARGFRNEGRPDEPTQVSLDGEDPTRLFLEDVVPILSVDPFQSAVVTTGSTYPFVLSGQVSEWKGDPYFPKVQYQIGSSPPVVVATSPGPWSTTLQLAPGTYPISVTASDDFSAGLFPFAGTLTVFKYTPPSPDPTLPKTLADIPTTASITSWTRLEPQCYAADLDVTASARLFDPLWLMTRQWQVGEFQGEDAGSPVQARVRSTNAAISRFHPGELSATSFQSHAYRASFGPLEANIERRPMRAVRATDLKMLPLAVDAGLHFLRMLEFDAAAAKYRPAFLAKYPLPPLTAAAAATADAETLRFVATMAGRAPDARLLVVALRSAAALTFEFDASLAIAAADKLSVQKVAAAWVVFYNTLFADNQGGSDTAWLPSRLEYAVSISTLFSAAPQDEMTFSASEFDGGRLDWSSFDVNRGFKLDTTGDKSFTPAVTSVIPAPVSIKGAPAPRFWEMEDAKVAYGLLSVGPTDLAHLMMIEYASSYGNDWYVVPLTTPVGSVTRVDSLVVTDTFGVRSLLRPIGDPALDSPGFSMWQPSELRLAGEDRKPPISNAFFLPPTLGRSIDGEPVEDVLFMRDEMANLAWGIERTIEGGLGTAVPLAGGAPTAAADASPHYVLSTMTPSNWVPLMPVQVDAQGTVQLKRAATLQIDGSTKTQSARSAVLNATANLMLYDEEVPREGVRITQRRRMARWIDGSTWVWKAFRNEVGRGEGSAGLRFDQIGEDGPPS